MDYYSHTNQKIMVGHFPGETKIIEAELMNELSKRKFTKPDNITFVCPFTEDIRNKSILINQITENGYTYCNSLSGRKLVWDKAEKANKVLDTLKMVKSEYSLILDTNDVVILTDLDDILDRFNDYKKEFPELKMLYNSSIWMHPHILIDDVEDRYKYGDFCWLNAGCCLCETEYAIGFYQEACDLIRKDKHCHKLIDSEQYYIRKIFNKHQDKVFFDYKCSIFQCWHKQEYRYDGDKCYLL